MSVKQAINRILPAAVAKRLRCWHRPPKPGPSLASSGYEILAGAPRVEPPRGWQQPDVAEKRHAAFAPLVAELRAGRPRVDFTALAEALAVAGVVNASIIELGCGSGWNWLVLERLLQMPFRYTGLDCSPAMIDIARREFPRGEFVVGDALAAPFPDGACDILVSGGVLMDLVDYARADRESRRLARRWGVYHTVPVLQRRATTFLRKQAYGGLVVEVIFNETELLRMFAENGLAVRRAFASVPYDLGFLLGEATLTRTYLCEVKA